MIIKSAFKPVLSCVRPNSISVRSIFGWFDAAFNKYDDDRVAEVGIDRAAAEWASGVGAVSPGHQGQ